VVLARAGLARIDRLAEATETLDPLQMLPAPGQGALAVECREDRSDVRGAVAALDDEDTRVCVTAERALLAALEAGCTAPVGALAEVVDGEDGYELSLRAVVGALDGSRELRCSLVAPVDDPVAAGRRLAALLLEDGAADLTATAPDLPIRYVPSGIPDARYPLSETGAPEEPPSHSAAPANNRYEASRNPDPGYLLGDSGPRVPEEPPDGIPRPVSTLTTNHQHHTEQVS
jgi:hydroxymethylbilane synthase